jgi:hypothetical protein
MTDRKHVDEDAIRRGIAGNAMSDTDPAQPAGVDQVEADEAQEANLEMEQAFEAEESTPAQPGADKVGSLTGSPD